MKQRALTFTFVNCDGCSYFQTEVIACFHRAAVLERMPVIQKNSLGQTNGELSEEPIKESQPGKVKQEEMALPQQPAGQVW